MQFPGLSRRALLAGTAAASVLAGTGPSHARIISGMPGWVPDAASPPKAVDPAGWEFFTPEEAASVEALVDRIIPPDPQTPGGKDAGCAVFIDRQLAGPYGSARALYMRPPFYENAPATQGAQSPLTPAERYRRSLAALDQHCTTAFVGKHFHQLSGDQQDALLTQMQKGQLTFPNISSQAFFEILLQNTREGFLADPVYGGNRNMAGWRHIGFAGARYDYRDWVHEYDKPYPRPPVSIGGRPEWTQNRG
jgi:gluconate 2-dehydrogenase gamma chain